MNGGGGNGNLTQLGMAGYAFSKILEHKLKQFLNTTFIVADDFQNLNSELTLAGFNSAAGLLPSGWSQANGANGSLIGRYA